MPRSEGNVRGLSRALNGWLAERFWVSRLWDGADEVMVGVILPETHSFDVGEDGDIAYHLVARNGSMAVWLIDAWLGQTAAPDVDGDTFWCTWGGERGMMFDPTESYSLTPTASGECMTGDPPVFTWTPTNPLAFMTISHNWQPAHMRSDVAEYVVALGECAVPSPTEHRVWEACLQIVQPEQTSWVVDQLRQFGSFGEYIAPNDPLFIARSDT